jgi:fatty-acyl-CoA synthase
VRLIDYFDASAQSYPSKTAFIQPDGACLTCAEVEQQSRSIASALHASALPEKGKVAVYSPNDARAFIAMLAIFRSGRI